jgi:threonine dehydratase
MEPFPAAISAAAEKIRTNVRKTPLLRLAPDDLGLTTAPLSLKLELLQHAGSFKTRGAFANLLLRPVPAAGVAAASGGNHGAAVAFAAQRLGIRATIFVPSVASPAKVAAIRGYGAELSVGGERYADALVACDDFVARSGAMAVHAYDSIETLLGTGTLGCELEEQCPDIDTVLIAVGGGGLIGGVAAWFRGRVKVVAVEPETAPTLHYARAAGRPVDAPAGGIAADSLAPRQVGQLMFPISQSYVAESILVQDDEIREAQYFLWERLRLVTEPGGATAFAALLARRYRPAPGERVAVVLCGGNTDALIPRALITRSPKRT